MMSRTGGAGGAPGPVEVTGPLRGSTEVNGFWGTLSTQKFTGSKIAKTRARDCSLSCKAWCG